MKEHWKWFLVGLVGALIGSFTYYLLIQPLLIAIGDEGKLYWEYRIDRAIKKEQIK